MIEVQGLTRTVGNRTILRDVSLRVAPGEIVGFLGPNGAGKTTTLRILAGVLPPSSGMVRIAGSDVAGMSPEVRRRIGYLPERVPAFGRESVRSFLRFVGRVRGLGRRGLDRAIGVELEQVGLGGIEGRALRVLSKGERQRVGLASALLGETDVLLLDEPTSGLDPRQLIDIRELIRAQRGRRAVLLSTHLLPEASSTCDRVVVLNRGRVVAEGSPAEIARGEEGDRLRVKARGPVDRVLAAIRAVEGGARRPGGGHARGRRPVHPPYRR